MASSTLKASERDPSAVNAPIEPADGVVVAVVSDVHGNRWALEAVLDDAQTRGARLIIDLGDLVYGPLEPGRTLETIRSSRLPLLRVVGNEDRIVWEIQGAHPAHPSLEHTRSGLTTDQVDWLRDAPREATWARVHFFHGRPQCDGQYLLEAVETQGLRAASASEVNAIVGSIEAHVVLCGHSHVPRIVGLDDGRIVLNPGSVGLQAYRDASPLPHVVGSGDPRARYAQLTCRGGRWVPTFRAVRYDWTTASREAQRNGRPDWAHALETGLPP